MPEDRDVFGSLDDLAELFEQERVQCDHELAQLDPSALAAQAMARAGLSPPSAPDALDLELKDLFSVERAQVLREAQAALLPTAPGLAPTGVAAPTLLARLPALAKWGLGLSCAAGLAVVTASVLEGKDPVAWSQDRAASVAAWALGPKPSKVAAPRIEFEDGPRPARDQVDPAPRLMPKVPDAIDFESAPQAKLNPKKRFAPADRLEDRLRRLEREAQEAWRAKNRVLAEQKFNEIVTLAPQSSFAQWAWGDLFLLAKQSQKRSKRRGLWKRYLKAHPRGRFADAAFAGLCASSMDDKKQCWGEYLKLFPSGASVAQAKREGGK